MLGVWAGEARAKGLQVEFDLQTPLFLDRTYLFASPNRIKVLGDPESPAPLLVEGQFAPNLFLPQLRYGDFKQDGRETLFSLVFTPKILLRMLNTDSNPILPPSYMPKFTLQAAHLRLLHGPDRDGAPRMLALGLNVIVGHHSNGEDGCFFANQTGKDPDCTPAEGQLPLNEVSGSFSTNLLRFEVHGRLGFGVDPHTLSAWIVGANAFYELNTAIGPGGLSPQQRTVYGDGHWGVGLTGERTVNGNRFRLEGALSHPFGETPGQRSTLSVELAANPWWGSGFGVFARYVRGQDYYNILFLERISLWQFGLVFELNPGTRLKTDSGKPPGFQ
ncbi:hypothetical protein D7V88_39105 [Corallococcus terminator]|uniref:Uncharacterized protein n=1 Tax=Corallococcus terminator TaxID=2316733 RepID=A0A3A8HMT0_9BACT|nr:hypothetical protein D7V88_39105 [Corallococcus terminator]